MTQLISAKEDISFDERGGIISSEQEIGDDYWNEVKEAQDNFAFRLNGLTPVASIPESVVNKWIREGFDFWNAPAKEIIRKLKSESYDRMILSGDKTF